MSDIDTITCERDHFREQLTKLIEALGDNLPSFEYIEGGNYREYTGELVLSEDAWSAIRDAKNNLKAVLFDLEKNL